VFDRAPVSNPLTNLLWQNNNMKLQQFRIVRAAIR